MANAWTEVRIPDRTRNVPTIVPRRDSTNIGFGGLDGKGANRGGAAAKTAAPIEADAEASLPAITLLPPVVGLAIGAYVFGERINASSVGWALDVVGAAMAVAGVFALARSHLSNAATNVQVWLPDVTEKAPALAPRRRQPAAAR